MTVDGRRPSDGGGRMRDVTHAHSDHDPRAWHWFARGPTVAADGGEPSEARRTSSDRRSDGGERTSGSRASSGERSESGGGRRDADEREGRPTDREGERAAPRDVEQERIRDVSHQPDSDVDANRVWERGEDDRDEVAK